jgi:hypothetical protein
VSAAFLICGGLELLAGAILLAGVLVARRRVTRLGYAFAAGACAALGIGLWLGRPSAWWLALALAAWSPFELARLLIAHPGGLADAVLRPAVAAALPSFAALALGLRAQARSPFLRRRPVGRSS